MTIIDRKHLFINTYDKNIPKQNQSDIILRNSDFAQSMYELFNYYWNDSLTISEFGKTIIPEHVNRITKKKVS